MGRGRAVKVGRVLQVGSEEAVEALLRRPPRHPLRHAAPEGVAVWAHGDFARQEVPARGVAACYE